ncbi:MAG: 2,4-dihydroxyhept-2-ene-1,7-dioic acid aldolase [Flavobacteriales bacterium]|nr:2,4-dihydroxyhept-2-ene-1,7-dioic acid aldolase [Flavobacteriales bacterium]
MINLKKKLKENQLTIGSWITIGHQSVVEVMCSADFDWLTLDLEHSVIELSQAQNLIAHIQHHGKSALVRVAKNEEVMIKRVMDAGADGVIVPMVNSAKDAQQAVSYVKYPPLGRRGVGLARAQQYGIGFDEYKKWLEQNAVVIVQIEHIEAVRNIDEILNTDGIDGIIIGPYDLSGSMGVPGEYHREEVKAAIQKVEQACLKYKKPLGFHVIQSDHHLLEEKVKLGYSFLAFSLDFFFLGDKVRSEMQQFKLSQS